MTDDIRDPVFSQEKPVVELVSVQRLGTLSYSRGGGIDNPALDLSEPPSPLLNLHTPYKQQTKKKTRIQLNECSPSDKGISLPGPKEFSRSWENIEEYLKEQSKDTNPEVPFRKRKPFYRRRCFSCTMFVLVLLLLLGGILGIGYYRAVVLPSTLLWGQIPYNPYSIHYDQYDAPVEHSMYHDEDMTDEYSAESNTTDRLSTMFHDGNSTDKHSTKYHDNNNTDEYFKLHKDELTQSVGKQIILQDVAGIQPISTEMFTNSLVDPFFTNVISATTDVYRTLQESNETDKAQTIGENKTAANISELQGFPMEMTQLDAFFATLLLENDTTFDNGSMLMEKIDDRRNSTVVETSLQDDIVVFQVNQTTDVHLMPLLDDRTVVQSKDTQNTSIVQNNTFLDEVKTPSNESAEVQRDTIALSQANTTDNQINEVIESQDFTLDLFLSQEMQIQPNETNFQISILDLNNTTLAQVDGIAENQNSTTGLFQFNPTLNETDNVQNVSTTRSTFDQQTSSGLNNSVVLTTTSLDRRQQEEINRWLSLLSLPGPLQFQNRFPEQRTNVAD